jgi:amino acid adenylation domain-containing protein
MQEKSKTYQEIEVASNTLAHYLLSVGVPKGTIIAILVEDRIAIIIAILGILKAGCVFVPCDTDLPRKRLQAIFSIASPQWCILETKFYPHLQMMSKEISIEQLHLLCIDKQHIQNLWSNQVYLHPDFNEHYYPYSCIVDSNADDMSYLYFTSGSTGQPKAIAGRLKGIDHFIRWEIHEFGLTENIRTSQLISPAFDAYLRDIFVPLCAGGTLCLPTHRDIVLDGEKLASWVAQQRIHLVHCTPSLFRLLIRGSTHTIDFSHLQYIFLSGEPLHPSDVKKWIARHGTGTQLINLYGPSETTMTKFFYSVVPEDQDRQRIPIGKPMPGSRAIILNDQKQVCPTDVVGEIYIRTPYRALGYYKQPLLTEKVFLSNPFHSDPSDIIYKTGDLGRLLNDGNFELLGRKDRQIKIRGVRIEPDEIENILLAIDGVHDAVVIDLDDKTGDKYLCAYVVAPPSLDKHSLRVSLAEYLPESMLPSAFVFMKSLPRTQSGKIDRQLLPSPHLSHQPSSVHTVPRNHIEELLTTIWGMLLPISTIGIDENFFELGGHSLLATQLLSRIRNLFGVEPPLRSFFDNPTIAHLGEQIQQLQSQHNLLKRTPIRTIQSDRGVASFAQQRLWFLQQLEATKHAYILSVAVKISANLNVQMLQRSVDIVVERQAMLRTTFSFVEKQLIQIIHPTMPVHIKVIDLKDLEDLPREDILQALVEETAQYPFDFVQGTLLRITLFRLSDNESSICINMHHIIADGWSIGVFLRELFFVFNAIYEGKSFQSLKPLSVQYLDFSNWQHMWFQGEVLQTQLAYWRNHLQAASFNLHLPTDYLRPAVQTFRGASLSSVFPEKLLWNLHILKRQENVTTFMILLTAFQILLGRYSGQDNFVIGIPIAGRTHNETEELIGCFVNTLALKADLAGNPDTRTLLARIRQTLLESYEHQDLPFEQLVEDLQPPRDASRSPLFQVMCGLQTIHTVSSVFQGLHFEILDIDTKTTKFDLFLSFIEDKQKITAKLHYNTVLFKKDTIQRLLKQYQHILEEICIKQDQKVGDISFMDADDLQQILTLWNLTQQPYPHHVCLHHLFEAQTEKTPDAIAVIYEQYYLTYSALNRYANSVGNHLQNLGFGPESIIGLYMYRTTEVVVTLLGTLKAGAAYVALDPAYPQQHLQRIMDDANLSLLITNTSLLETVSFDRINILCLEKDWDIIIQGPHVPVQSSVTQQNLAYLIYTSGSTGLPKGVSISHASAVALVSWAYTTFSPEDYQGVLAATSLCFDLSIFELFLPLCWGGIVFFC